MNFWSGLTIRTKAIVIAMVCSITALLTSAAFNDLYQNRERQKQMRSELTAIAIILAERSTAAVQFGDSNLANQNLSALDNIDVIENACMYDDSNQLFASYRNPSSSLSPCSDTEPATSERLANNYMYIDQPIILDDSQIGSLHLTASLTNLEKLLAIYLMVNLAFCSIAAVIALILAARLQKYITRPINNLRETAANIENSHDYSIRAQKQSADEVGELATAFNTMLDRIQSETTMLSESESRFRTLTGSSPFGVFQNDINGDFVYVNERWREMTGIDQETITGELFIRSLHPEERFDIAVQFEEARVNQEAFKAEFRILHTNGKVVSTICQARPIFNNDKLTGYIGSLADVSELKGMQEQLERLALYDPLTHLANRRLFKNQLEKAIRVAQRNQNQFALMFIDFDHFKKINDSLGHDQGDELLIAMAKRLMVCVRPGDTIARLGGDEFTILAPDITNRQDVDAIARKIQAIISQPVSLDGQAITATCSIGITIYPDDSTDANVLMKNADMAMYQSKDRGRNRFQYFSEDMNMAIKKQLRLETDLRRALISNEFELYYQPKIDLSTETITGYEALIRWIHPKHGMISPGDFIPVAEESGLISNIGQWVLQRVCDQIPYFLQKGLLPPGCRIAINLSAKQFHNTDLVSSIHDTLNKNSISPEFIELEITESLIMRDISSAISTLHEFRAMGITLSIDDFGTGYSSFNYLKRLPIDSIKIDRSFVMDIPNDKDDMEITSAIIAMAHNLRLIVVAEGLETEEQKQFLRNQNCDIAQGYFFGRPLPAEKLAYDHLPKTLATK